MGARVRAKLSEMRWIDSESLVSEYRISCPRRVHDGVLVTFVILVDRVRPTMAGINRGETAIEDGTILSTFNNHKDKSVGKVGLGISSAWNPKG